MSQHDDLNRTVAALSRAAFNDTHWSVASALIDGACRVKSNTLFYGYEHFSENPQLFFIRLCYHGQRNKELERVYIDEYYPWDEAVPRVRRLHDSQVVHVRDLFTEQEQKTSPAYNEMLPQFGYQNALTVRLNGPPGTRIVWSIADSIDGTDWSSWQIDMIERLLPHIRQFVGVRQALVDSSALGTSLSGLLDHSGCGVIQLDRRGRIVATNDVAQDLLRRSDGLRDQGGILRAWSPPDDAHLRELLERALPRSGGQGASGSMTVKRPSVLPRLVLHISPAGDGEHDFPSLHVAALVLVVDPASRARINPELVAESLGLTPAEGQVAALLAEGKTVREIASTTGRRESTIRWHLHHICNKHGISRQVELVQLVLPLAGIPPSRY